MDLTQFFKDLTAQIANWIEVVASLIIAFAVIEATLRAAKVFITPHMPAEAKEDLRLRLGRWLAVALEFALAADILRTAISPTWQDVGLLAAIATIRTALNYFLQQEIDRATARATGQLNAGIAPGTAGETSANGNAVTHMEDGERLASSQAQAHEDDVIGGQHVAP